MVTDIPSYKPCIISNPKKRIVYSLGHSENHETGELSDCDGFYPKIMDDYRLGQIGLFLKYSKKDIQKLEQMCNEQENDNLIKVVNPFQLKNQIKPICGKSSLSEYLKKHSGNILNPISLILVYNKDEEEQFKLVPYHKLEILSSNSEGKIIEWTKDIENIDYHERSMKCLLELQEFYNRLKSKEDLFQIPIEWAPYASKLAS